MKNARNRPWWQYEPTRPDPGSELSELARWVKGIRAHNTDPSFTQNAYAWGDNGSLTAGSLDIQNVPRRFENGSGNVNAFLRQEIIQTDSQADQNLSVSFKLQRRVWDESAGSWGSWGDVTASSTHAKVVDGTPADGDAVTTNRITATSPTPAASTATYANGEYDEGDGALDTIAWTSKAVEHRECVWSLQIVDADFDDWDIAEFRIVYNDATPTLLASYAIYAQYQCVPTSETYTTDFVAKTRHTHVNVTGTTLTTVDFLNNTPASGTYLVLGNLEVSTDGSSSETLNIYVAIAGTAQAHSHRLIDDEGSYESQNWQTVMTQAVVTVNGSQEIQIAANSSSTSATHFIRSRQLLIIELEDSSKYVQKTAVTTANTASASFGIISDMSVTEGVDIAGGAGDYLVIFSSSVESATAEARTAIQAFVAASGQTHTRREVTHGGSFPSTYQPIGYAAVVSVTAGQVISVRMASVGATGTVIMDDRTVFVYGPITSGTDYYQDTGTAGTPDTDGGQTFVPVDDDAGADLAFAPATGDWIGHFTGWWSNANAGPQTCEWGIESGGAVQSRSRRRTGFDASLSPDDDITWQIATRVNVGASETVKGDWKGTETDTRSAHGRTLLVWKPLAFTPPGSTPYYYNRLLGYGAS